MVGRRVCWSAGCGVVSESGGDRGVGLVGKEVLVAVRKRAPDVEDCRRCGPVAVDGHALAEAHETPVDSVEVVPATVPLVLSNLLGFPIRIVAAVETVGGVLVDAVRKAYGVVGPG